MPLPSDLQSAIDNEVSRFTPSELKPFAEELSNVYRQAEAKPQFAMRSDAHRCAYLATRMPATYGAVSSALTWVQGSLERAEIRTVLDVGAGPGTASWAAASILKNLGSITLMEKDAGLTRIGKSMAVSAEAKALREGVWISADLRSGPVLEPHDLVLCSYVLSELPEGERIAVVKSAWAAARKMLVIVDTGTPAGFACLRDLRKTLVALGAQILAPCPHVLECPMISPDWCHFSTRVERTKLHRYLKSAELGYEDEKFSYLVFTKSSNRPVAPNRILRHPLYTPGSVELRLCAENGKTMEMMIRKSKDAYKRARKAEWGDPWSDREQ